MNPASRRRWLVIAVVALISGFVGFLSHQLNRHSVGDGHADLATQDALALLLRQTLPATDGRLIRLDDWRGQVRVVNYWATWCPPCREEMPMFSEMQRKYADRGVRFVGIGIDSVEKLQRFAAETPVAYPLVLGDMAAMQISSALGNHAQGLPFTIIIDRQGVLDSIKLGRFSEDDLESRLQRLTSQ